MTDARPGVGILENRRRETTMSDKKWIKAEDVARLAGVSRSAVSRTFTPGASVSEKTRQKVLSAAEALGYQVNIIARTMITGSSNFIGIVTAGFDNPFRSKLLAPLVHQLALNGFMPLLMNADDPQQLAPSLKQLLSYHVAGVIITSGAPPLSLAEEYLARKMRTSPAATGCAAITPRERSWWRICSAAEAGGRLALLAKIARTSAPASAMRLLSPGRRIWR